MKASWILCAQQNCWLGILISRCWLDLQLSHWRLYVLTAWWLDGYNTHHCTPYLPEPQPALKLVHWIHDTLLILQHNKIKEFVEIWETIYFGTQTSRPWVRSCFGAWFWSLIVNGIILHGHLTRQTLCLSLHSKVLWVFLSFHLCFTFTLWTLQYLCVGEGSTHRIC